MSFTKMYLLNEDEFRSFKNDRMGKERKDDITINRFNQKFEENKVEKANADQMQWSKLSDKIVPILKEGVVIPQKNTQSKTKDMTDLFNSIKSQLGPTLISKGLKLFTAMTNIPNVVLSPEGITVNGQMLFGSLPDIINDLVKNKKVMIYDIVPLLQVGRTNDDFVKSINNRQALEILNHMKRSDSYEKLEDIVRTDRNTEDKKLFTPLGAEALIPQNTPERSKSEKNKERKKRQKKAISQSGNGKTKSNPKRSTFRWQSLF